MAKQLFTRLKKKRKFSVCPIYICLFVSFFITRVETVRDIEMQLFAACLVCYLRGSEVNVTARVCPGACGSWITSVPS